MQVSGAQPQIQVNDNHKTSCLSICTCSVCTYHVHTVCDPYLVAIFAAECGNREIRLAGWGNSSTQGRVEVCNFNRWGSVCDDTWDVLDATVACYQLGYSTLGTLLWCIKFMINVVYTAIFTGVTAERAATYGRGTGAIFLDDLQCDGTEGRLFDCNRNSGQHNCYHAKDAGATCTMSEYTVRVKEIGCDSIVMQAGPRIDQNF